MSQPPAYTPSADFSQDESNNVSGRSTVRTSAIDTEFSNIAATLSAVLANLLIIQRDDGRLADFVVTDSALSTPLRAMLASSGSTPRGEWVALMEYAVGDLVEESSQAWMCHTAHTAGPTFSGTNWIQISYAAAADIAAHVAAADPHGDRQRASHSGTQLASTISDLADAVRLYSALRGNSDTKYKIVSGVIRQSSSGSGWELIDDANHSPVNVDSVSVNGSGNLSISYSSIGAVNKAYFSAWPDETFAGWGMRMGCSVGNTSATIEIYAPYGGAIVASSATPVQPIIPLGHVVTQTLNTAKGTLVVAHETQSHSSGYGSPVSVVASGNNGMWAVTSTKSDFTLTYRRQCVGAVSWSGGNPSVNTAIAYPGPYNVTATASSSGKIRLDIGTHELYAGMAVDVASVTGTTEANYRWYIDSVGSGYIVLGNSVTTGLPSAYVNPWAGGGTVTMVKVLWKTDHIEIFHPYAGSQQFIQCQMHKGATWLDCQIDNTSITTYGFHAYFYDNAGTLVSTSSSSMGFSYQREAWLPAAIPTNYVGQVTRDNIRCNASGIYNANGNIWFCGIFEVA